MDGRFGEEESWFEPVGGGLVGGMVTGKRRMVNACSLRERRNSNVNRDCWFEGPVRTNYGSW